MMRTKTKRQLYEMAQHQSDKKPQYKPNKKIRNLVYSTHDTVNRRNHNDHTPTAPKINIKQTATTKRQQQNKI